MRVRLIVDRWRSQGPDEDSETFLRPVAFPMTPTDDPGVVAHDERDLRPWADSELAQYRILDVPVPLGAVNHDDNDAAEQTMPAVLRATTLDPADVTVRNGVGGHPADHPEGDSGDHPGHDTNHGPSGGP